MTPSCKEAASRACELAPGATRPHPELHVQIHRLSLPSWSPPPSPELLGLEEEAPQEDPPSPETLSGGSLSCPLGHRPGLTPRKSGQKLWVGAARPGGAVWELVAWGLAGWGGRGQGSRWASWACSFPCARWWLVAAVAESPRLLTSVLGSRRRLGGSEGGVQPAEAARQTPAMRSRRGRGGAGLAMGCPQ